MRKHSPVKQNHTTSRRVEKMAVELCAHIEKHRTAVREEFQTEVTHFNEAMMEPSAKGLEKIIANQKFEEELRNQIEEMLAAGERTRDERAVALGIEFLETATWGDDQKIKAFIKQGVPVTYQDTTTGKTALHAAAATQARDVIRVFLSAGERLPAREYGIVECDFLIRDNKGRLPSELAYLYEQ